MNRFSLRIGLVFLLVGMLTGFPTQAQSTVRLYAPASPAPRVQFGLDRLTRALEAADLKIQPRHDAKLSRKGIRVVVGSWDDPRIAALQASQPNLFPKPGKEGFVLHATDGLVVVAGADASGTLYGCLELADRIEQAGGLPETLDVTDQPEMVLRGACIGLQKTTYLPGRKVYEYPYTPETFPWFYDKALWIQYLDQLVANRMNSLYLWNGHPFASLVRLADYPYAVEVDDATFQKNEEMFRFLTEEADKRGIWVIQMFYNILVSKPFAEHHQLETQDRERRIVPVIADYTRKSIAAFVEKYPNVGLLMTLGEAMSWDDDVEWFTKTIIPGVQDGLQALGTTTEPPIVLRGHDTDPETVMEAALPLYKNLYTMHKYNGEALTTYQPRGPWAEVHRALSELGSTHIENVHILANLEPFRYGSPDFIQKSVRAMHEVHGANGLHLYPQASYWDWPYTADAATPRLRQLDRDWIWYEAWARYAWDVHRDRPQEIAYWSDKLGTLYGCGPEGHDILTAYEESGEIAPKLLRRFGITNGNRQTLLLGMTMSQLVNPERWRVWELLYSSDGPEGEKLADYVRKELQGAPHVGETPPQILQEVVAHAQQAVAAIDRAAPAVTKQKEEFARLQNDMHCYEALARFFDAKVKAAMLVLEYGHTRELRCLEAAIPLLEASVRAYEDVVRLTKDTYLYANSMQTAQRRIPISGEDGSNKTWAELLPHYQQELANFKRNVAQLQAPSQEEATADAPVALSPVKVQLLSSDGALYPLQAGQSLFQDEAVPIQQVAPALQALQGVRWSRSTQQKQGTTLRFKTTRPMRVLVGYFDTNDKAFVHPPDLETNANANDRGQAELLLANALEAKGMPPVQLHGYTYPAGTHTLSLSKGLCLVLGFVDPSAAIPNASATLRPETLDQLFD
ncbi:hypothetical protein SAMN05421823_10482 [Catalinimonas alkaloidigena]|uniref:Glycosyl hydrolase family 20, domain 2 n=1 Tax=Catalinimonas alkaloidigena TaxID=1075417 RepID=A0A1G9GE87_9BACT|nr:hypothetical protein [Catalinimonas alkaloidigena]SDK99016.1 hypothetical protein SAMN05421823_10482 [Catalinimonas alkaloidigena]